METLVTCHVDLAAQWRGGQRQVYLLTTGLAARGWRTVVVTGPGTPLAQKLVGTGVEVRTLRALGELDLLAARRLANILRETRARIVAAHASHEHGLAMLAKRAVGEVKLVVHRRVDVPIRRRLLGKGKYQAPDKYIAISEKVRAVLIDGGVPADRIALVSSGVPAHVPDPLAKVRLAAELRLAADAPWVGSVADLVEHKGHRHLLDAWVIVRQQVPQARLVLIGDGELRAALAEQARALGIADRVHFVGRRNDVPAWLNALQVFTLTSTSEGLGSSIIDAMMAGVPVVATAAGGIPELVRDGETGLLAPARDVAAIAARLIAALQGGETIEKMKSNALAMVRAERSADAMVEGTMKVYRDVAG